MSDDEKKRPPIVIHVPSLPGPEDLFLRRTREQREANLARLEREVELEREKCGGLPPFELRRAPLPSVEPVDVRDALQSALHVIKANEDERATLPCNVAIRAANGDADPDLVGRKACDEADAASSCRWRAGGVDYCPRVRAEERYGRVLRLLKEGGIDNDEDDAKLILASVRLEGSVPLLRTDPFRVVLGLLKREMCRVPIARHSAQIVHGGAQPGYVDFRGNEKIAVLIGNPGVGKSIAAMTVIAARGGAYVLSYDLARRGFDVDALKRVNALVIDQVGREPVDATRSGPAAIEELVIKRAGAGRLTVLAGPIEWKSFAAAYPDVVDRARGFGVVVEFGGDSLR